MDLPAQPGQRTPRIAAAQGTPAPPSKPTGQVIVGLSQEPTVFNPLMPHIEVDQGVHWNIFSPLWNVDADGNFIPQLATEVPTIGNGGISEDGLEWRIKLRPGVTWHDGTAFTADDVKFTLELINNPHFRVYSRNGHELVTDVKVVSPTEITWRMKKSYAPYASILSWTFIVPAAHPRQGGRPQHGAVQQRARRHRRVPLGRAGARRSHHTGGERTLLRQGPISGAVGVPLRA